MFRNWGFLIGEMIGLLLIAALIGLFVGWLIWARRKASTHTVDTAEVDRLNAELKACRDEHRAKDARIASLSADYDACRAAALEAGGGAAVAVTPIAADATGGDSQDKDYDGDGVIEGKDEGTKPATLSGPRGGQADDLKQIKGIGPKLEKLCHSLGFYHFDQIASWTDQEVAWVDANLDGFKGRVSRDTWVEQAKILAAGGTTDFANKVKDGGVY